VEVILDTGFTGYLTLPAETIRQLGLASVGRRTFELANGELFEFEAYLASVSWHENLTDALVLRSDSDPLLGMTLLWGSRVTLDAIAQGEVSIEDLESEPPEDEPDARPIARGRLGRLWSSVKRTLLNAAFVIAIVAAITAFAYGVDSLTLNFGEIITFMGIWLALGVILGQNKPPGTQVCPYLGRRIISFACTYLAFTAIAIVYVVQKDGGGVDNIKRGELLGLLLLSLLGFAVGFYAGQDKDPIQ
jgi:clan AA aspartic protease